MIRFRHGRALHLIDPLADIAALRRDIKSCRICLDSPAGNPLPHAPNPVAVLSEKAKIVICGQAPGNKVNISGVPFMDPSGDRLRHWLGVSSEEFYNPDLFAIVPMGFCFPGYDKNGSDLPPRKECQAKWHEAVFDAMPQLRLKLLVGGSAQKYHLGGRQEKSVTQTVENWRNYLEGGGSNHCTKNFPLPHPSWRNSGWLKKNRWFDNALLPELRKLIQELIIQGE